MGSFTSSDFTKVIKNKHTEVLLKQYRSPTNPNKFKSATIISVRLGYCFTPYRRLWLYNGAPLVAFYDTLGPREDAGVSRIRPPYPQRVVKGD